MKSVLKQLGILYVALAIICVPVQHVMADETYILGTITSVPTFRFNNENWLTVEHPKIISFTVHSDGSADGMTETGISFIQYNVPNSVGIRVQRFEIEDHYHYIIDGEIVYTVEEFSAHLALAYNRITGTAV